MLPRRAAAIAWEPRAARSAQRSARTLVQARAVLANEPRGKCVPDKTDRTSAAFILDCDTEVVFIPLIPVEDDEGSEKSEPALGGARRQVQMSRRTVPVSVCSANRGVSHVEPRASACVFSF